MLVKRFPQPLGLLPVEGSVSNQGHVSPFLLMSVIADSRRERSCKKGRPKSKCLHRVASSFGLKLIQSCTNIPNQNYKQSRIVPDLKIILGHAEKGTYSSRERYLSELEENNIVSIQAFSRVSKGHSDSTIRTSRSIINLDAYR